MTKMDQSLIAKRDEMAEEFITECCGDCDYCDGNKDAFIHGFNKSHALLSAKLEKLEAYQEANRQLTRMMDINDELNNSEVARFKERITQLEAAATKLREAQKAYMKVRNDKDIRESFGKAVEQAANELDEALERKDG